MLRTLPLAVVASVVLSGCAGSVEVTRTFTPEAASRISTDSMQPTAVIRGEERLPLPSGARVEADRVVLPREGRIVHRLAPRDVLVQDELGRIVAVRTAGESGETIRFVPGTAASPDGSAYVRGEPDGPARSMPLRSTDGIEMHGKVPAGQAIPGGGRVEGSRSSGWLGAGLVLLALSYAPTAYAGAASSRSGDRMLEIPLAGPWLDIANRPACVAPAMPVSIPVDLCVGEKIAQAAIITSGAIQDLSALFVLVGLPASSRVVEGSERGVALIPTMSGARLFGRF